jgi:hypothetical protein
MKNKCPHPTCTQQKPREQYACRAHWFSLPKELQRRIYAGYRGGIGADWVKADRDARAFWEAK